ncbi:MAG: saccharopine dehydrogenase C-terminal domain-containing protein [Anaerolineales bacterium]
MKIVVFGAGMVGSAFIKDLAEESEFEVLAVDFSDQALQNLQGTPSVTVQQADLKKPGTIPDLVKDADLVVSAVPGFMGFNTLQEIIESGRNAVDISFFPEDPFELDELAKQKGITAVVDCGVAPGLCNLIAGYVAAKLDKTDYYHCYVGGLPEVRQWPFEYKAVFSPVDVLEEYTRPARFVENGQEVIYPALSGVELIDFPEIGTLEAFNTDGLRTLRNTLDIPTMREKTLRYPGHANLMRVFRESGFFSAEPLEINSLSVQPLALTSRLLFDQWRMTESDRDITVMQVLISGWKGQTRMEYQFDLIDHFDDQKGISSMARTTGYTCTIIARQLLNGTFTWQGICPPELIGGIPGTYPNLISEYQKRGIQIRETIREK